jgi:hypothetical protein
MGAQPKDKCKRGHELEEWSTLPANPTGRRCRACNRAISTAFNWEKRLGLRLTEEGLQDLADHKFSLLKIEMGVR